MKRPLTEAEILKVLHPTIYKSSSQVNDELRANGVRFLTSSQVKLHIMASKQLVEMKFDAAEYRGKKRFGWRLTGEGLEEKLKAEQRDEGTAGEALPEPATFSGNKLAELTSSVR